MLKQGLLRRLLYRSYPGNAKASYCKNIFLQPFWLPGQKQYTCSSAPVLCLGPSSHIKKSNICPSSETFFQYKTPWDLAELLERLTASAEVARAL